MLIFKKIANLMPDLNSKLMQARLNDTPESYVQRTIVTSLYISGALIFISFMFTKNFKVLLFFPFLYIVIFFYFLRVVDYRIKKMISDTNKEIIFAGRFLIIELESGVPMFTTFENMARNYDYVGIYFEEIVDKVYFGTGVEDAINQTLEICPSPELRKIFWQISNSLKTGSNITDALQTVIDQIVREQQILVKEYGRKLNPMAMFYMMIAIIVPSLGVTMLIILSTFVGFNLSLDILLILVGLLAFVQFMFLAAIRSSRPPVDL